MLSEKNSDDSLDTLLLAHSIEVINDGEKREKMGDDDMKFMFYKWGGKKEIKTAAEMEQLLASGDVTVN